MKSTDMSVIGYIVQRCKNTLWIETYDHWMKSPEPQIDGIFVIVFLPRV